jgi:hypothetical protein
MLSQFIDVPFIPAVEVVWRKGELAEIDFIDERGWSSIMHWIRAIGRKAAS